MGTKLMKQNTHSGNVSKYLEIILQEFCLFSKLKNHEITFPMQNFKNFMVFYRKKNIPLSFVFFFNYETLWKRFVFMMVFFKT